MALLDRLVVFSRHQLCTLFSRLHQLDIATLSRGVGDTAANAVGTPAYVRSLAVCGSCCSNCSPVRSDGFLSSYIPYIEFEAIMHQGLDVEPLELVKHQQLVTSSCTLPTGQQFETQDSTMPLSVIFVHLCRHDGCDVFIRQLFEDCGLASIVQPKNQYASLQAVYCICNLYLRPLKLQSSLSAAVPPLHSCATS